MSDDQHASTARLLGGFEVVIDGRRVTHWRAGRSRALFQYLLSRPDRVVTTDRLREVLWPHPSRGAGPGSVKAAVHGARWALRAAPGRPASVEIRSVDGGYLLHAGGLRTDVDGFTTRLSEAAAAARSGDNAGAATHYRGALTVYTGPYLPGLDADWAVEQREWLRTLALRAMRFIAMTALDADDQWTAIEWCRRAIDVDPYDGVAYEALADSHRRLGLVAQARRWDRLARLRLADP